MGETCSPGETPTGSIHYCQAVSFEVDLNVLDMCVAHFVDGVTPDLVTSHVCSLERNLGQLLDQDGNGIFNIFDVDGCVRAFVNSPGCNTATQVCPPGFVYCEGNDACGEGLYCDTDLHRCRRDCGFVGNRELNGVEFLERPCFGHLKTCDYNRGSCEPVQLDGLTCQVDGDCPQGAYCYLGFCEPTCSRSVDCPGSDWHCSPTQRCMPNPSPAADDGFVFDPRGYVVQFATKDLRLSEINNEIAAPLLIMDLRSKRQVFDNPSVVFGYRAEVTYSKKQDARCNRPSDEWSDADRLDCLIDDSEEFVNVQSPFGAIFADGNPAIEISLNDEAAGRLTPGLYQATLTAIYNNGGQDSLTISFRKTAIGGEYVGRLSVYYDRPQDVLGTSNLAMQLHVDMGANPIAWHTLLARENLQPEEDLVDVSEGLPVAGVIHGNESLMFNLPSALSRRQNEVPVRGIYSPELGRMRLIAVIDIEPDFCRSDFGTCGSGEPSELVVDNVFGRKVRRLIEFVGPFDARLRRFGGVYRETLTGLVPYAVTLDGGFLLEQLSSDNAPVDASAPLLTASGDAAVGFPEALEVQSQLATEVKLACAGLDDVAGHFVNRAAFDAYMDGFDNNAGAGPILPDLVHFEGLLQGAVDTLDRPGNDTGAALTLYEFLQGQIFLCTENDGVNCIDEQKVRCGMALYRKAILNGWIDRNDLMGAGQGDFDLFCSPVDPSESCTIPAANNRTLAVLHEHNRFFRELTHALKYQAASDLSDAFFTLFRNHGEASISQAESLSHKNTKLTSAWNRYNQVRVEIMSPTGTAVLFDWPMAYFRTRGNVWLDEIYGILAERIDAFEELVDIKRRAFVSADEGDFVAVHHLLQMEYLSYLYLMFLQKHWQQESFAYTGNAGRMLDEGQLIAARVNETRNPLGFHPNQIFFENGNLQRVNWVNYKDQLRSGGISGAGLLGDVNAAIQVAISDLKASLSSTHVLKERIRGARQEFERSVAGLCGPAVSPPGEKGCDLLAEEERKIELNCRGVDCRYDYRCEGEACESVAKLFNAATGDSLEQVACRIDTPDFGVLFDGAERPCVRGQMGALLQEKAQLELQRRQIFRQVNMLLRQVHNQSKLIRESERQNQVLLDYLDKKDGELTLIQEGIIAAEYAFDTAVAAADALDCTVGTSSNCAGKAGAVAARGTAIGVKHGVVSQLAVLKEHVQRSQNIELTKMSQQEALRQQRMVLDNLGTGVENLIAEYELVTQQIFNLNHRLMDTHFLATQAAKHHKEEVDQLIENLVGSEPGSALRRNAKVQQANNKFLEVVRVTYKMAMAFIHSYNLRDQADQIINQVFQIVTPRGVEEFIDQLETFERDYCGLSGIDCDAEHNVSYLRFSLRDELFPTLRDIVDPRTGAVLTKGEQFHNLITSSAFIKKRKRGTKLVEQIELPFAVWLNDRGAISGAVQRWMLSPFECNHIVVGRGEGSVGVNVVGTRLSHNIEFEILRGNTDFIRACEPHQVIPPGGGLPVTEYPINPFIVGYAPHNALALQDSPPSFLTRSGNRTACKNRLENSQGFLTDESCYFFFARDRSLAAPDWKVVIPVHGGVDNRWILGDGLPEDERPIVEDIVVYVRYRKRPIESN
jgi:hypothetical protein